MSVLSHGSNHLQKLWKIQWNDWPKLHFVNFLPVVPALEEITGVYEQLTPLQFHFIEKPAQILQIPSSILNIVSDSCTENRTGNEVNLTKNRKNCDFRQKKSSKWSHFDERSENLRFRMKISPNEVNLTKNSSNEVNLTKNCARNKSLRFWSVYKGCVNSKQSQFEIWNYRGNLQNLCWFFNEMKLKRSKLFINSCYFL